MKYKCVLLFGPPGSGKGLQGKILGNIPGIIHSSMGDIFRGLNKESETGKLVSGYSSSGKLVPDEITIRVWKEAIERMTADKKYHPERDLLLLDGIPRTAAQAEIIKQHAEIIKILHLTITNPSVITERIKKRNLIEGRADDANPEIIKNRILVYSNETLPVLKCFADDKKADVDASMSPLEVLNQIVKILIPLCK